jgi:hypothetical protein
VPACRQTVASPTARSLWASAPHLDVIKADDSTETADDTQGIELLERIVAMLTKLIHP